MSFRILHRNGIFLHPFLLLLYKEEKNSIGSVTTNLEEMWKYNLRPIFFKDVSLSGDYVLPFRKSDCKDSDF